MLRCARGKKQQHSIAFQRSDDEEEEEHRGEEENVGDVPNEEEEEAELERVPRQTQRSHVHGNIFDLFSCFYSLHDAHFFCLLCFSSWLDTSFNERGDHRQVNQVLCNLLRLHYP
jgi:hypothetical protein